MTNTNIELPKDMTTEEYEILMEVCKGIPCKSSKDKEGKKIIHNKINQIYIDNIINECWD
ncbi:hypothetical protein G8S49_05685 [Clostridium botulinum C]|uniref:Uncharacterized protein n=2 Tax=Clostridium botulinum TaxID=1491 RepID=A0A9Q4XWN6_CLOBO|nr:hypothetical protein [Clostridium botulinum]YP_398509.1 hypothetical protein CST079 [Clostridium phage c-st]MCD3194876.1 hypothetical protein [Clostridium botulinum C]MCD3200189.1 hypothetical protein [Clostridium botulinum C]MCD3205744.1 hypothetical protein [Clostridium botulinum C]MCD3207421.1 hypothetical protein [Clostridium botulinum C]MCD3226155.1 hypothetical protein [Clostridium botulinum C]